MHLLTKDEETSVSEKGHVFGLSEQNEEEGYHHYSPINESEYHMSLFKVIAILSVIFGLVAVLGTIALHYANGI